MEAFLPDDLLIGYTSYYVHLRPNGSGNWIIVEAIDPYWAWLPDPGGDPSILSDIRSQDFDKDGNWWGLSYDQGFVHTIAQDGTERYAYVVGPVPPDYYNADWNGPTLEGVSVGNWSTVCGYDGRVHWFSWSDPGGAASAPRPYKYLEVDQDGLVVTGPLDIGDRNVNASLPYIDAGSSGAWTNYARTELWQPEGFNITGFPSWIARLNLETLTYSRASFSGGEPNSDGFCYSADNESYQSVCECADGRVLIATIFLGLGSDPRAGYHIYLHDSDGERIKEYEGLPQSATPAHGRVATLRLDPIDNDYFLYIATTSTSSALSGYELTRVNIETGNFTQFALPGNNGAVRTHYGFNQFQGTRGPWSIGVAWTLANPGIARYDPAGSARTWFTRT